MLALPCRKTTRPWRLRRPALPVNQQPCGTCRQQCCRRGIRRCAGKPIIYFHGTPGTPLFYPGLIMAVADSAHVIAFDRPGYGGSDFYTGWGLLECADDVAQLADSL